MASLPLIRPVRRVPRTLAKPRSAQGRTCLSLESGCRPDQRGRVAPGPNLAIGQMVTNRDFAGALGSIPSPARRVT